MLPIYKVLMSHLINSERDFDIMCMSKSVDMPNNAAASTPSYKTPTLADASVTKTSDNVRRKALGLGSRNIRTSARGLEDEPATNKRKLLGE